MISYMPLMRTLDKRGMVIRDVEKKLGLSASTLLPIVNTGRYCTVETLLKIAEVLNCGIGDMVEWTEEPVSARRVAFNLDKLRKAIDDSDYNQTQLSLALGHSNMFLSRLFKQNGKVSVTDAEKICRLLNVTPEDLL